MSFKGVLYFEGVLLNDLRSILRSFGDPRWPSGLKSTRFSDSYDGNIEIMTEERGRMDGDDR